MANITTAEKDKLFTRTRHMLGAPIRGVELEDSMLETFLEVSIEDYSSYVNNWLIEQQWDSLVGLDGAVADLSFALTTRSLDFVRSFTFAYSKQQGLGTNGPWELKKDFVTLTAGTQVYTIPKDREVNEVLWLTPPFIDRGLVDPFSRANWSAEQFGWSYIGRSAEYVQPVFNILLSAQDRALKNRIRRSEMTFRITGGPNGTKLLYLYPVPGRRFQPGGQIGSAGGAINTAVNGTKIWYWYYDANVTNVGACKDENKDIIRLPSDVDIDDLSWSELNKPAQTWVRRYLLALSKQTLGKVRGKFSGALGVADAEVIMDYADMLSEGIEEQSNLIEELRERLEKLEYVSLLERKATEAESLNKVMSFIPLPIMAI
ncbi:hypothetical protein COB55_03395 [Candidatus Wolfebacteria bacterium]|nr:MAG: hypothetical protein COB55_03395 [Candidatus Wolfebacteria bacterium]